MHHEPPVDVDLLKQMGYQKEDLEIKPLIWTLFGLGAFTIFAAVASWFFFVLFIPHDPASDNKVAQKSARRVPVMAALQVDPMKEISDFRATERKAVEHAGWVDKEKSIARIPVHEALERVLEKGLPTRGEAVSDPIGTETTGEPSVVEPKPTIPAGVIPEKSTSTGAPAIDPNAAHGSASSVGEGH